MPSLASQTYEALAKAWEDAGRISDLVTRDEWQVFVMVSWMRSDGGAAEGYSAALHDFAFACYEAQSQRPGNWFTAKLRSREHCDVCGQRLMLNNMSVCTGCKGVYCFNCAPDSPQGPYGNRVHRCGGDLAECFDPDPSPGITLTVDQP